MLSLNYQIAFGVGLGLIFAAPQLAQDDEHYVSFAKNLDNDTIDGIKDLIKQRMWMEHSRDFSDFVKMSFWAAVLSHGANGHDFTDIHQVSLDAAQAWWQSNFTNYGCYCWPDGEKKISGFGKPVDQLDQECFDMYSCYRCVSQQPECKHIDWVESHYDCQFLKANDTSGQIEISCNDPDPCLQSLCECDKKFALNAKEAMEFRDESNVNIFPEGCPRTTHHDNKACCGDWPSVNMYSKDTHCCGSDMEKYALGNALGLGGNCEDSSYDPTLEDMYVTLKLNINNPDIAGHNHNSDHSPVSVDHTHMAMDGRK